MWEWVAKISFVHCYVTVYTDSVFPFLHFYVHTNASHSNL